jgi:hypothetical protein
MQEDKVQVLEGDKTLEPTMKHCGLCGKKVPNDQPWDCAKCDPPGWGMGGW